MQNAEVRMEKCYGQVVRVFLTSLAPALLTSQFSLLHSLFDLPFSFLHSAVH